MQKKFQIVHNLPSIMYNKRNVLNKTWSLLSIVLSNGEHGQTKKKMKYILIGVITEVRRHMRYDQIF